jgi:hypothetical protein
MKTTDCRIHCVLCGQFISYEQYFIPLKCLLKNGSRKAHRLCEKCWFSKFTKEDADHKCPGCVMKKPFNTRCYKSKKYKKIDPKDIIIISD